MLFLGVEISDDTLLSVLVAGVITLINGEEISYNTSGILFAAGLVAVILGGLCVIIAQAIKELYYKTTEKLRKIINKLRGKYKGS